MQKMLALILAGAFAPAGAILGAGTQGFLSGRNNMQPDAVAHTLAHVQDEWRAQVVAFYDCVEENGNASAHCATAPKAFHASCGKVLSAVVQASNGDRASVKEYFNDVCGQKELNGWHRQRCTALSVALTGAMTQDDYDNRESLDVSPVCNNFWNVFSSEEHLRLEKEHAEREAAEKQEQEEQAKEQERAAAQAAALEAKSQESQKEAETRAQEAEEKIAEVKATLKVQAEVNATSNATMNVSNSSVDQPQAVSVSNASNTTTTDVNATQPEQVVRPVATIAAVAAAPINASTNGSVASNASEPVLNKTVAVSNSSK
jgi:hypothetical protein